MGSDRAVSAVVGFVLVFGVVMTAFTVYQGVVVPDQNRQAELRHDRAVQGEFLELRDAVVETAVAGRIGSATVNLGATYPRRALARNLAGPGGGSLRSVERPPGIRVDDVVAVDPESRAFVDGDLGPYRSAGIRYDPGYSFYTEAPATVYENTVVYRQFADEALPLTGQALVDGRRITLVSVGGYVSRSFGGSTAVDLRPVSPMGPRVAVENTTGGRVTLTVPSRLGVEGWSALLADELVENGGYVEDVVDVPGRDAVRVALAPNVVYELGAARVGIARSTAETRAAYVIAESGDGRSVPEGAKLALHATVRDRFNNPVSGVPVSVREPAVGTVSTPLGATSGMDGRVVLYYRAPEDVGRTRMVTVAVAIDGASSPTDAATFDVQIWETSGE